MKHASVQVRALMKKEETERYEALMEIGQFLESKQRFDYAYTIQSEIDLIVQPAIERLKERGRERDRQTEQYLKEKAELGE